MIKPAIVAVGYNRPESMKRLLDSIGNAHYDYNDITLIISIDECDKSNEVETIARKMIWKYGCKEIRRFPVRQGLRKHIIQCGDLSEKYGAVIILEDDLYVSPDFYSYVCQAQSFYDNNDRIAGISLYSNSVNVFSHDRFVPVNNGYDNYFGQYIITWGESWTFKQWSKYKTWYLEHEDNLPKINYEMPQEISTWTRSWGKYFISYMVEKDLFYVMPYTALTTNFSEQGEHKKGSSYETAYQVPIMMGHKKYTFAEFENGIKYDSFFERIMDDELAPGVSSKDVCFDLYGTRIKALNKKYLLTCKKYPFHVVKTFGLRMRPIDLNVQNNIEGDGITLYEMPYDSFLADPNKRKNATELVLARTIYEVQGLRRRQLTPYIRNEYASAIKRKFANIFKKK